MGWRDRRANSGVAAEPPGPRGQILFVAPLNGGIGGMERLTRSFADWAAGSGFGVTMVFGHTLPSGPYSVSEAPGLRVLRDVWSRALERTPFEYVYVMPAGLRARRWVPRLQRVQGTRVVLDLDPKRKFLAVTDVYHCETPRDDPLPRPHVVALPDPRPTMATSAGGALPAGVAPGEFDLTVFTPYGPVKGHVEVPRFAAASLRPLVWCHDPTSFAARSAKLGAKVQRYLAEGVHPNVVLVRAGSPGLVRDLYDACAGYVCFSQDESFGYAMADAIALGKPLCARRVGVCRALPDFAETTDFAHPVFRSYELPDASGYEGLFQVLAARSLERAR